ncbi:MAG: hypothetical protein SGARI_000965 [Bacillariaceae sp.]
MPDYFNNEMKTLQETTEQIRLSPGPAAREQPRPSPLGDEGRVTTADIIANEIMAKPAPLLGDARVSTIDALDIDLDGSDSVIRTDDLDKSGGGTILPRPSALGPSNRLTTQEIFDIVSAPLEVDDNGNSDDPLPV